MDPQLFEESVTVLRRQRPFRPFTLVMNNGDRLEVDHPDALTVRGGSGAFLGPAGVGRLFSCEAVNQVSNGLASETAGTG